MIGIYPADQTIRRLDKELGVFMGPKHISADEESVTAVTVFRGLGRAVMPENGFDCARVDAVRGNDEVARHDRSVRKSDGRSVWILF